MHELFSAYPTLSKRVSDLLDIGNDRSTTRPPRNPFAYLLALFCPGARYGIFGIFLTFYLVFILAGVAVPAALKVKQRAQEMQQRQQQSAADLLHHRRPLRPTDAATPAR